MQSTNSALDRLDEKLSQLERRLRIDKFNLDTELVEQGDYYNQAAQSYADAVSYRDEAKAELSGIKSKLDLETRQRLTKAEEKFTEAGINARVITEPEYQNALNVQGAWEDRVLRWSGLQEAVKQRGYALKDLAALAMAGYWADANGSVRGELRTARAEQVKDALAERAGRKRVRVGDQQ